MPQLHYYSSVHTMLYALISFATSINAMNTVHKEMFLLYYMYSILRLFTYIYIIKKHTPQELIFSHMLGTEQL